MGFWFAYFLGAFTFLPIICGIVFALAYISFPEVFQDESHDGSVRLPSDDDKVFATADAVARLTRRNSKDKEQQPLPQDVAAGYFAVTREYVPGGVNGKPPERPTPNGNLPTESPSVYQTMYRSLFERKPAATSSASGNVKGRNVFFVVLRHGHLMLYDDEEQVEVRHMISLGHHTVSIYGGEGEIIPEGELYIKRNAIKLTRKATNASNITSMSKPFFLFCENCSDKEDFYFALVKNQEREESKDGISPSRVLNFETRHIISLVQRLHSTEEDLQTRWLNGLVGRVFLALYKTAEVEDHIRSKITKKIARVKRPAFLSNIVVQKIDCGEGAPFITNPKMRELTADGEFSAEADVKYSGNFRIEISTVATLSLGNRIKPRQVPLVLAVVFKKLEGHAILRLKPPPSNRLWFTFTEMPKMDIAVEPIVSTRQITWNMVLRPIENRIKEVVAETVVSPNWDDIPFIHTDNEPLRGGLWECMRAGNSKNGDAIAQGSVEDAEKQDKSHEEGETPSTLVLDQEKSASMPILTEVTEPKPVARPKRTPSMASSPLAIEEDKAVASGMEAFLSSATQRSKKKRSGSIGTPTSSTPVVATTNVYASAERQEPKYDNDKSDAVSSVMSITRSRSSSGSAQANGTSPFQTPYGSPNLNNSTTSGFSQSPSVTTIESGSTVPTDDKSVKSMKSWRSTGSGGTMGSTNTADSIKGRLGTIKSNLSGISFPSVKAFNINSNSNTSNNNNNGESATPPNPASSPNPEKNTFATITNAGVAVKKWYINSRKKDEATPGSGFHPHGFSNTEYVGTRDEVKPYPNEGPPKMSEADLKERITGFGSSNMGSGESRDNSHQRNGSISHDGKQYKYAVAPLDIPPPPPKRTEPINVPKRRSLPPPMLPPRHPNGNGRLAPPDMEEQQMMVIAAPQSEPTTPGDEMQLQDVYPGGSSPEDERRMTSSTVTLKGKQLEQPDYEGEGYGRAPESSSASVRSRGSGGSGGSSERWEPRERPGGRRNASDPDEAPRSWDSEEEWRWRNSLVSEITGEEG
ncbi:hypothetical protein ABW19_dt0201172 [Dactylella cylindrospora]|nr:hypothetical protein ABW19_dt0201172 [Dactylella cylindrospora]